MRAMNSTCSRAPLALLCVLGAAGWGCTGSFARASFALLVPKLALHVELGRTRHRASPSSHQLESERQNLVIGASLRWQPSVYAASVPERYELAPSVLASPCELDDVTCIAEQAETDAELASALQEVL